MHRKSIFGLLSLFLILLVTACANPADDKPVAEVSEVSTEPATEPSTDGTVYTFSNDGSAIGFVGSKVTGSHEGGFNTFSGSFNAVDGAAEGSSVLVNIDTTSLWSDNDQLTGHLKSADFFDVEANPTATFASTSIVALEGDEGSHTVTGELDLHGVTKQISFPATVGMSEAGFSAQAEFSINRFDFAIEYAGKADDLIREEVVITFDLNGAEGMAGMDDGEADGDTMTEPTEEPSDDAQAH